MQIQILHWYPSVDQKKSEPKATSNIVSTNDVSWGRGYPLVRPMGDQDFGKPV